MPFRISPFQIQNLTTDYGDPGSRIANIGTQFLGGFEQGRKRAEAAQKQELLGQLSQGGDFNKLGMGLIALGDTQGGAALLGLGQKAGDRKAEQEWLQRQGGAVPSASPQPALPAVMRAAPALGAPNDIEERFMGGIKTGGLTNPAGLAAVAATGRAESGFSPANVNREWNDPSESGAPGQAGGIMSWRAERLANLKNFAKQRGEEQASPETQAAFLLQEDPALLPKLNAAKTAGEANQIMADAWRYAGYNREGGERDRRLGLTQEYARKYSAGEQQSQPQQVAQASVNDAQPQIQQSIMSDPAVRAAQQAFMTAPSERTRAIAKQQLDLAVQDAKTRIDQGGPLARENQRLNNAKLRREVEGEGSRPMTAEERQAYNVPNGQPAYMNRQGDPKFGPAGTNVNIDQKLETEEAKAIGQAAGKRAGETMAGANAAGKQLRRLGELEALLGRVNSGKLEPTRMSIAALGKSMGVDDSYLEAVGLNPKAVGDAQAVSAISGRMLVDMIGAGAFPANNFSDADRNFLQSTLPNLSNDPRANSIMMESARRVANIDIDKAKAWREFRKANPKGSFDDFEIGFIDKISKQERFADLAQKAAALSGAPAQQGAQQPQPQQQPPKISSPEQYQAIPSGAQYVAPDGSIRTKR